MFNDLKIKKKLKLEEYSYSKYGILLILILYAIVAIHKYTPVCTHQFIC